MDKIYSVIALPDDGGAEALLRLRRELPVSEEVYNNSLPHITISIYDKSPGLPGLIGWTRYIAETHAKFKIRYSSVGIFLGNRLIAIPSFSSGLYSLYRDHHQKYDNCCKDYSSLKNDVWFPHTGIYYTDKQTAAENIARLAELFRFVEAEITALRVTEFDHAAFREIAQFELENSGDC